MKNLNKLTALILAIITLVSTFAVPAFAAVSSKVADNVEEALPIVTYATPLSGEKKVYAYSNSSLTKKQTQYYIDTYKDLVVIKDISKDGKAVYATYPTSNGKYRSKWFKTEDIIGIESIYIFEYEATKKNTVYRMSSSSAVKSNGAIAKGDDCICLGERTVKNKTYYITIYPISKTTVNGVSGIKHKMALNPIKNVKVPSKDNKKSQSLCMDVPLFKQNNPDWASVKIGSKTIGQIGCLTTCISMVYSYHENKHITPDNMKDNLRYSNNDLIWSSLKDVDLTSKLYNSKLTNTILSSIYSKLKDGKPVIIGATTASGGSQHW